MRILLSMASTIIRSSYSLRPQTANNLEWLAKFWNVSKSEALRRAIDTTKQDCHKKGGINSPPLKALAQLAELSKKSTRSPAEIKKWKQHVREERLSSSEKRMAEQDKKNDSP